MEQKADYEKYTGNHYESRSSFVKKVLYGDLRWARLRLIFLVVFLNLFAALPAAIFEGVSFLRVWHNLIYPSIIVMAVFFVGVYIIRDLEETADSESTTIKLIFLLIVFIFSASWIEFKIFVAASLNGPFVGQYLLVPFAVFFGTMFAGAKYLQDVYDLDSYKLAFLYLISSLFGIAYPYLIIDDGQQQIEPGKVNRLNMIGGPGYIQVSPSDAILIFEPPEVINVQTASTFFISRFGKIISVINLQDQRASIDEATAYSKDGIKITVRDIALRYRIWSNTQIGNVSSEKRNRKMPYPFSHKAVRASVFNLSVDDQGNTSWSETVKGMVRGKIMEYISSHQFDQIVMPNFQKGEPRQQIQEQIFAPETRDRLMSVGAKLLLCDIGHFEGDRDALQQRLETWSAKWIGNANVIRAEGEAQRVAFQELGRAEAQADMLTSIVHAFGDIDLSPENKDQNIRNVILMRTAQVLESLIDARGPSVSNMPFSKASHNDRTNEEERRL